MYPKIVVGDVHIFLFGIFLMISWVIFFYSLHILSQKKGITKPIFSDIISFTLAMFVFGRLFHMLSAWRDTKFTFQSFFQGNIGFLEFIQGFFIMEDYNLSLAGGIIGFILVFFYKTKNQKNLRAKYLDIILPSFFIAGIIGFFGAFIGGQIYGTPSNLFFAADYNTKYSTIPGKLFPLAAIYAIICIIFVIISTKLSKKEQTDGYIGYILMG